MQASPRVLRHTILVAGPADERLEQVLGLLRTNGFYAVGASGETAALEALHAPYYQFTCLVVLSAGTRAEELGLCQHVRAHKLPVKTVLSLLSGNQDELDQGILQCVDAAVPFDVAPQEFLSRLRTVLAQP